MDFVLDPCADRQTSCIEHFPEGIRMSAIAISFVEVYHTPSRYRTGQASFFILVDQYLALQLHIL